MIDAISDLMGFAAAEIHRFKFIKQVEVFMVAVDEKRGVRLVIQPVTPPDIFLVIIPYKPEIACYYKIIFLQYLLFLFFS